MPTTFIPNSYSEYSDLFGIGDTDSFNQFGGYYGWGVPGTYGVNFNDFGTTGFENTGTGGFVNPFTSSGPIYTPTTLTGGGISDIIYDEYGNPLPVNPFTSTGVTGGGETPFVGPIAINNDPTVVGGAAWNPNAPGVGTTYDINGTPINQVTFGAGHGSTGTNNPTIYSGGQGLPAIIPLPVDPLIALGATLIYNQGNLGNVLSGGTPTPSQVVNRVGDIVTDPLGNLSQTGQTIAGGAGIIPITGPTAPTGGTPATNTGPTVDPNTGGAVVGPVSSTQISSGSQQVTLGNGTIQQAGTGGAAVTPITPVWPDPGSTPPQQQSVKEGPSTIPAITITSSGGGSNDITNPSAVAVTKPPPVTGPTPPAPGGSNDATGGGAAITPSVKIQKPPSETDNAITIVPTQIPVPGVKPGSGEQITDDPITIIPKTTPTTPTTPGTDIPLVIIPQDKTMPTATTYDPALRNFAAEGGRTIAGLQGLQPQINQLYGSASQAYSQSDLDNLNSILGRYGQTAQDLTGLASQQTQAANTALRQGNLADVAGMAGTAQGIQRNANQALYGGLDEYTQAALTAMQRDQAAVANAGQLTPEEVRNAQQAAREGWAARGLVNSQGSVAQEVLNREAARQQREAIARANAQQSTQNMYSALTAQTANRFDPFATVLGAQYGQQTQNVGTNQQLYGQTAGIASGAAGNQFAQSAYFPWSAYSGDLENTNVNAINAQRMSYANNQAALQGANTASNQQLLANLLAAGPSWAKLLGIT